MRLVLTLSAALLLPLMACAGSSTDDPAGGGDDVVDAAVAPSTCTVPSTFGGPRDYRGTAQFGAAPMNPALYGVSIGMDLDGAPQFDGLTIDILTGFAPFGTQASPTPIVAGTYPLTGDQAQYKTCGVCTRIISDIDPVAQKAGPTYLATGGTLEITQAGTALGQPFAIKLTNVTLEQVNIAADLTSTPAGTGCTTTIPTATFTGTLGTGAMAARVAPAGAAGKAATGFDLDRAATHRVY